jgi:hypothetical protein
LTLPAGILWGRIAEEATAPEGSRRCDPPGYWSRGRPGHPRGRPTILGGLTWAAVTDGYRKAAVSFAVRSSLPITRMSFLLLLADSHLPLGAQQRNFPLFRHEGSADAFHFRVVTGAFLVIFI